MSGVQDIAAELARHQWYDASSDREDPVIGCTGCPDWFGGEDALDNGRFALHQTMQIMPLVNKARADTLREAAAEAHDRVVGLDGSRAREAEDRGYMQRHNVRSAARWMVARADDIDNPAEIRCLCTGRPGVPNTWHEENCK